MAAVRFCQRWTRSNPDGEYPAATLYFLVFHEGIWWKTHVKFKIKCVLSCSEKAHKSWRAAPWGEEEVTGNSRRALCRAGNVTPGSCQSRRSLLAPPPLPNTPRVVSSIHTWALAQSDDTHPVTASQRASGKRQGRIRPFTYGKVTNSLQARR